MKIDIIRNIIIFLDILISIAIIISVQRLIETPFGIASLIFGFVMLAITTLILVLGKI